MSREFELPFVPGVLGMLVAGMLAIGMIAGLYAAADSYPDPIPTTPEMTRERVLELASTPAGAEHLLTHGSPPSDVVEQARRTLSR